MEKTSNDPLGGEENVLKLHSVCEEFPDVEMSDRNFVETSTNWLEEPQKSTIFWPDNNNKGKRGNISEEITFLDSL